MTRLETLTKAQAIFNIYVCICRLKPNYFIGWFYTDITDHIIKDIAKIEWNVEIAMTAKEMIEKYDS